MSQGKILVAEKANVYLLKLTGDVRLTLCASITDYINKIFKNEAVEDVYVDLLEAECIDSTTLGLLAKLALHTMKTFDIRTKLLCVNKDILRIFEAMDIDNLFDILGLLEPEDDVPSEVQEIKPKAVDEDTIRQQVLEAHQLLVKLNPELMNEFFDLITSLQTLD